MVKIMNITTLKGLIISVSLWIIIDIGVGKMNLNHFNMKEVIQNLLDSNISAYRIGKEAGVQDSLVKKLRNGEQQVGDTKFNNLEKLYKYSLEHSKEIFNIDSEDDIKLPKNVLSFIDDLKTSVSYINSRKSKAIENVYVYDKFQLNEKGDSDSKISYIEIQEDIPIPLKNKTNKSGQITPHNEDYIPYSISISSKINSRHEVNAIRGLRITFDSESLINDLKSLIKNGGNKVKVKTPTMFSNYKSKTLYVYNQRENTEFWGFESDYFDIQYKREIQEGNFPLNMIKDMHLRDSLGDNLYGLKDNMSVIFGEDDNQKVVKKSLEQSPHMIIAGNIGSGKQVGIRSIVNSLTWNGKQDELLFAFIDKKETEFKILKGHPFNVIDPLYNDEDILEFFEYTSKLTNERYEKLKYEEVSNVEEYNHKAKVKGKETMKRLFIFIEDVAELQLSKNERLKSLLIRISQKGRSVGLHLVLSTSSLESEYFPLQLRSNIPTHLIYKLNDSTEAQNILDNVEVKNLKGKGDALLKWYGEEHSIRLQSDLITKEEIKNIIKFMKHNFESTSKTNENILSSNEKHFVSNNGGEV